MRVSVWMVLFDELSVDLVNVCFCSGVGDAKYFVGASFGSRVRVGWVACVVVLCSVIIGGSFEIGVSVLVTSANVLLFYFLSFTPDTVFIPGMGF